MVLSPNEVVVTLSLVVPGFLALTIARLGWGTSRKLGVFDLTTWSIFLSALIDFMFFSIVGIGISPSPEDVIESLTSRDGIATYAGLVLIIGVLGAFALRLDIMRGLRSIVWIKSKRYLSPTPVWDDSLRDHLEQWIVLDFGGRIVQGFLLRASTGDEPKELYILNPREVVFDDTTGEPQYFPMGSAMLIQRESVVSIRFLERPESLVPRSVRGGIEPRTTHMSPERCVNRKTGDP